MDSSADGERRGRSEEVPRKISGETQIGTIFYLFSSISIYLFRVKSHTPRTISGPTPCILRHERSSSRFVRGVGKIESAHFQGRSQLQKAGRRQILALGLFFRGKRFICYKLKIEKGYSIKLVYSLVLNLN